MANAKRKPLIAGNWKLNNNHLESIALVQKLAFALTDADFDAADVVVLPPFTNLRTVQTLVDGDKLRIGYGAQDISEHDKGAYTGEVSGAMLAKLGCAYALAGHSERRQYHHEDDAIVNAKVKAAFANDITPILCLGEGLEVRKAGEHVAHTLAQLDGALKDVTAEQAARLVIAYEPVWAIGTGEVATPEDAQEVCAALRTRVGELYTPEISRETRVLYGGSVKADNIAGIMAKSDVDGALVGGASLKAEEFAKLARLGKEK
ncbi:triosephosphate isomerase [Nocardiopsis mwathae]|uniref:Triosephosphate isomerase n=1 Tax=Nocardiopsis mwathae TaxID=1472723 RepID=A0A7W9YFC1_9ACTN|nr:triose-phosphate isomerase [Nocardiopsis mwathae]MBB6171129.1 triosephosphate isomerase [Nocardiopsis mwathae]